MNVSLIKHENETFTSQTIDLGGHAFINCTFEKCTAIYSNLPTIINGCSFNNCNWKINYDLLMGDERALNTLKRLFDFLDTSKTQEFSSNNN